MTIKGSSLLLTLLIKDAKNTIKNGIENWPYAERSNNSC